jgi:hypothetical protein
MPRYCGDHTGGDAEAEDHDHARRGDPNQPGDALLKSAHDNSLRRYEITTPPKNNVTAK